MPEMIFLLPEDAVLMASLPITQAEYVARLIEVIPDDWSDVSGLLRPADDEVRVVARAGYAFHRFDPGVRVELRQEPGSEIVRLLVDDRLPAFISLDETGFGMPWQFLVARGLAAGFVRKNFYGWLTFNNGVNRKYAHYKPAEVEFHLESWSRLPETGQRYQLPPALVLRWSPDYGGTPSQVELIARACRPFCGEFQVP